VGVAHRAFAPECCRHDPRAGPCTPFCHSPSLALTYALTERSSCGACDGGRPFPPALTGKAAPGLRLFLRGAEPATRRRHYLAAGGSDGRAVAAPQRLRTPSRTWQADGESRAASPKPHGRGGPPRPALMIRAEPGPRAMSNPLRRGQSVPRPGFAIAMLTLLRLPCSPPRGWRMAALARGR
jgi:hypothetical protein